MSPAVLRFLAERYEQIEVRYDPEQRALWAYQQPRRRPCFNLDLLSEIKRLQEAIQRACHGHDETTSPVRFLIVGSRAKGAFNLGGDLALLLDLVRSRDRQGLRRYALACVEVLYLNSVNLNAPLTTIALVQGAALGGGFEAAISCSVVIAERQVQLGLPEILFNLFPGMGAYSFLARRIHPIHAERLILSGEMWTAADLYERGVVDLVADTATGQQAVVDYMRRQERVGIATFGLIKARQRVQPVTYQELFDVAMIWADSALHLSERDLRVMERLLRAQNRAYGLVPSPPERSKIVPLIS
jgi:DSF synthase